MTMPPYVDWKPIVFSLLVAFTGGLLTGLAICSQIGAAPKKLTQEDLYEAHVSCKIAAALIADDWMFDRETRSSPYECKIWDSRVKMYHIYTPEQITTIGDFITTLGVVK